MNNNHRIPVYVLSGFLGSGKTTVLLHMLEHCKELGLQPGIILNELGDSNVESHLFKGKRVFELLNGCICCTIQDDLKETMDELILLVENQPLDILFIEGTGVANPLEIQEVLLSNPYIDQFELMSVITVLDANNYLDYQSVFSSSSEVRNLLREQMVCGSLLILNKTDLIPDGHIQKVKQKIRKITGDKKELVESRYGEVPMDQLFEKRIQSYLIGKENSEAEHHHHSTVQAIKLEELPPIKQKLFAKWLRQLPSNVLRGKGFVNVKGSDRLYSFQYASGKTVLVPVPDLTDRKPVIILIGVGIDVEQINNEWKQFCH